MLSRLRRAGGAGAPPCARPASLPLVVSRPVPAPPVFVAPRVSFRLRVVWWRCTPQYRNTKQMHGRATLRALAMNRIARRGSMPPPSLWSGFAPLRTERALPAGRGCAWLASFGHVLAAARLRPCVVLSVVACRPFLNLWRRLVLAAYRVQWPTLRPFARGPRCPALPSGGAPTPRPRCPAPFGRTLRTAQGFGDRGSGVPPPFFVGYARPTFGALVSLKLTVRDNEVALSAFLTVTP